jgi:hypothetical protein
MIRALALHGSNMKKTLALSLALASLLAACATADVGDTTTHEDKVYRTGSNIGRKPAEGQANDGITSVNPGVGDTLGGPSSVPLPRGGGH